MSLESLYIKPLKRTIVYRSPLQAFQALTSKQVLATMASSTATMLKASPVKSDWVKGQSLLLRQPSSVSAIRSHVAPSALTVRAASAYADELVKTAVINSTIQIYFIFIFISMVK